MAQKLLIDWLNDAYAMEQAQEEMLKRCIDDFRDYDTIRATLQQHLEDTKQQAEKVKASIESLGGDVSKTKSILGNVTGAVQGMSTGMYDDKLVRNMLMIYAGEHFEYISYLGIATAAKTLGEDDIASLCMAIAQQEKQTADWAEQQLPMIIDDTLAAQNT